MNKFDSFIQDQINALSLLHKKGLVTPLLMLLYATIDILSFVTDTENKSKIGERFQCFVEKYTIKYLHTINAEDLWGARCGLLHTNRPDSDFSRRGKAREILYSLGIASHEVAREVIRKDGKIDRYVALKIEDLLSALSRTIDEIKKEMESNHEFAKLVNQRSGMFYCSIPVK